MTTPVELISNFTEKKTARQISDDGGCIAGINGGFYTEDDKPLGWYFLGNLRQKPKQSPMFNGFVSNNGISRSIPEGVEWGFQSGPILVEDSQALALKIVDDRPARRSVLGVNTSGEFVLVAVDPVNLAELPSKINDLGLVTAINLDGGGSAAFFSPTKSLPEVDPVGSFLCVK